MTNLGQKTMGALVAAVVMTSAGPAGAQDESTATTDQHPTIVLHIVNRAAISREILNQVKEHLVRVYDGIGVRTVWVDSEQAVGKHVDGGLHLTVMLLPRTFAKGRTSVKGVSDDALGRAHPRIGRAYIFCDRVASIPGPKFFGIQLSAVIAHEVGHLLLPEKGHSRSGIMRAEMDAQYSIQLQGFDKSQARFIRKVLLEAAAGAEG
jgi:hypothetical protein